MDGVIADVSNEPMVESTPEVSAPEVAHEQQEKMIPQSQVNEIVKAKIAKAREGFGKDVVQAHEQPTNNMGQQNVALDIGQEIASELDKRLADMQRQQQEAQANAEAQKLIESLQTKIEAAASKYEDFEEVTKEVPYTQFPGLLAASNSVDNAGDVLYHLGKNPSKMRELASSFQPVIDPYTGHQVANPMAAVAMKELRQLSESMRNNELAKEKGRPGEPLNQIRPSNVKTDSGSSSIKQLRSKWTV